MTYRVEASTAAAKQIRALPANLQERIRAALLELAINPRPRGCKKLRGSNDAYRVRVGSHRILYEVHDAVLLVFVFRVADRKEAY